MARVAGTGAYLRPPPTRPARPFSGGLVLAVRGAFVYTGLAAIYPDVVVDRGPISVALAVALLLAALGWLRGPIPAVRRYLPWAIALAAWVVVSGVATWETSTLVASVAIAVWFVFIIPGLAGLLVEKRNFDALLIGLTAGVAIFVVAAAFRLASGEPVLDVTETGQLLLGENRNGVNLRVVMVAAFFANRVGPDWLIRLRLPLFALSALWILNSGGRDGLIGLAALGVIYGITQPTASRRVQMVMAVLLVGLVGFAWLQSAGGEVGRSTDRLIALIEGERPPDDEARELLLRKAWHLGMEHPFFGIGIGKFQGADHPVLDEARTSAIKEKALTTVEHNTYAKFFAETGFIGLGLFAALLGFVALRGLTRLEDPRVRATISSLGVVTLLLLFISALSVLVYLPIAMLLASTASERSGA